MRVDHGAICIPINSVDAVFFAVVGPDTASFPASIFVFVLADAPVLLRGCAYGLSELTDGIS
jgi:hypothetical protein